MFGDDISEEALEKFGTLFTPENVEVVEDDPDEDDEEENSEEAEKADGDDVSEAKPEEGSEPEDPPIPYGDPSEPDDLAVALTAAREELEAERARAAQYQEQVSHLVAQLQRPPAIPFDELSEEWQQHFAKEAAQYGTDPAHEYRLWRKDQEAQQAEQAQAVRGGIRGYFENHPDAAEYGNDVARILDNLTREGREPLLLPSYLPPQQLYADATWRIDALFRQAKLERWQAAQEQRALKAAAEKAAGERKQMKAATRGEATKSPGVNLGTNTPTSRRTPADDIKASFVKASREHDTALF